MANLSYPSSPTSTYMSDDLTPLWPPVAEEACRNPTFRLMRTMWLVGLVHHRRAAAILLATIQVIALSAGCSTGRAADHAVTSTYPLPSDGWKPGDSQNNVILQGNFQASLSPNGVCAWLGPPRYRMLWPSGYRVRFNPTELIGPSGAVVAHEGEYLAFHGGPAPAGLQGPPYCSSEYPDLIMIQGSA
jgi:hypothetical protein